MSLGLRDAGYEFIKTDDCWSNLGRDNNTGRIVRADSFGGTEVSMKNLSSYIRSRGMKFGIYGAAGQTTCAGRAGSLYHEYVDAQVTLPSLALRTDSSYYSKYTNLSVISVTILICLSFLLCLYYSVSLTLMLALLVSRSGCVSTTLCLSLLLRLSPEYLTSVYLRHTLTGELTISNMMIAARTISTAMPSSVPCVTV